MTLRIFPQVLCIHACIVLLRLERRHAGSTYTQTRMKEVSPPPLPFFRKRPECINVKRGEIIRCILLLHLFTIRIREVPDSV